MIAADVRTETSRLLAELIRIDTINPPGNETAAAEHLAAYLAAAGIDSQIVGPTPDRGSLVARIPGTGDGPALMLLGHTDTVGVDPEDWSVPPHSGLERDGFIWGRGALDMKGQVAAEAVAMATLAREGWRGPGDLILCAVADEEVGAGVGLSWLVEAHPDLARADYVVNEGGGERIEHNGRVAYSIGIGEKRCSAFAITVRGKSGHASTPGAADNALAKLGPVIDRMQRMRPPVGELPALHTFLAAIGEEGADPAELVARSRAETPLLAAAVEPMLGATIAPTIAEASTAVNIIPGRARLVCDCRILPGMTTEEIEQAVRAELAGIDHEFELVENVGGTLSPQDTPLYRIIEDFAPEIEPGASLAPMVNAGFTDSHFMREAFGSVAYGFMPMRMDPVLAGSLIHSADERAAMDDLELGTRFFLHVARSMGELA
jgi:acetylornithine deacetylase/succinyl-diaminopimelate desuccinylase-like protein